MKARNCPNCGYKYFFAAPAQAFISERLLVLGQQGSWTIAVVLVIIWATFIFSLDHFYLAEGDAVNPKKVRARNF